MSVKGGHYTHLLCTVLHYRLGLIFTLASTRAAFIMEPDQKQIALLLGLLYACGAGLELLVRISQGAPPHYVPPIFERNVYLAIAILFILPAILWPPISLYRLLRPLARAIVDCFRERVDTVFSDDWNCEMSGDRTDISQDVEKGYEMQDKAL